MALVRQFLRNDVRDALDAAETIKQFCKDRGNCGKCPFETNEGCLFLAENAELSPAGWNLDALE